VGEYNILLGNGHWAQECVEPFGSPFGLLSLFGLPEQLPITSSSPTVAFSSSRATILLLVVSWMMPHP